MEGICGAASASPPPPSSPGLEPSFWPPSPSGFVPPSSPPPSAVGSACVSLAHAATASEHTRHATPLHARGIRISVSDRAAGLLADELQRDAQHLTLARSGEGPRSNLR